MKEIAKKFDVTLKKVNAIYDAYWRCIKHHIESQDFSNDKLSEEDFYNMKPGVCIPFLGKLACSYKRYLHIIKSHKNADSKKN